jgi:hypothetical protein
MLHSIWICIWKRLLIYIYTYICTYTMIDIIYIYTYLCTYRIIYIYICTYMIIYICIYIHTQHRIRFSTILQSERQVVTNPAVRHGTDLLLVTFSFLCFVVCSFVGVVLGSTSVHLHYFSCSLHFLLLIVFLQLTESCCGRVIRLEVHMADEKKYTQHLR